jgi:hypothetical protein
MPEPFFFFYYSRADLLQDGAFINRLFEDLRARVATAAAMGITPEDPERNAKLNRVGFCDQTGVLHGEDWKAKIGRAIQHNCVLVCLYSPNFFSRSPTKQFCGKEVTAFLLRDRKAHYVEGDGNGLQLRGARNIIPILWEHPEVMANSDPPLPPYVLHDILWGPALGPADPKLVNLYLTQGLRAIARRHPRRFEHFVDTLAVRILEMSRDPLPSLPEIPEIERLRNAFWQPPHNAPFEVLTPDSKRQENDRRVDVLFAELRPRTEVEPWLP